MSLEQPIQTDVRDMYAVHGAFRRGLTDARQQLGAIADGDVDGAEFYAGYLDELFWLLHAHHDGEDVILYPLLEERLPDEKALLIRIDDQHVGVSAKLDATKVTLAQYRTSAASSDADALAASCESLWDLLAHHLREEEEEVLPWVERYVTPEEWDTLPGHAFSQYAGERMWLPFGLVVEEMPEDMVQGMMASPSPMAEMWVGGGADAFASEMKVIRGTSQ